MRILAVNDFADNGLALNGAVPLLYTESSVKKWKSVLHTLMQALRPFLTVVRNGRVRFFRNLNFAEFQGSGEREFEIAIFQRIE